MQLNHKVRTTINLHPGILHRAKIATQNQNISLSQLIEESLEESLKKLEDEQLKKMYEGLFALQGMAKTPITDASITIDIDEELYGENGAWRGDNEL